MLLADGFLGLVLFGVWVFCVIDVITTPEAEMRNLPKIAWLLLVVVLLDLGALLWLVAGRVWTPGTPGTGGRQRHPSAFPEYDRPGRATAQNPDDDAEFLHGLRERAEQQRRRHAERRQAELAEEQARLMRRRDETPE